MRLHPRYHPEKVTSKDFTRQHLFYSHLDVDKKRLVATNGFAMVCVPVDVDGGDRSGALPSAAVNAARGKLPIKARKTLAACGAALYVRPVVKFPDVDAVIPKYRPGDRDTITIGVTPNLLLAIADAMGTRRGAGLSLTFPVPQVGKQMLEPIVCLSDDNMVDDGAVGLLMPRRVDLP